MKIIMLICTILISMGTANAFEQNGFKTGMGYNEVVTKLREMHYDKITEGDTNIYTSTVSGRMLNFNFCNRKLVGYQIDYEPTTKNYINLVDEYIKRFGSTNIAKTDIKLSQAGQVYSLSMYWNNKQDYYQISYTAFPRNDSLYLYIESKNSCW